MYDPAAPKDFKEQIVTTLNMQKIPIIADSTLMTELVDNFASDEYNYGVAVVDEDTNYLFAIHPKQILQLLIESPSALPNEWKESRVSDFASTFKNFPSCEIEFNQTIFSAIEALKICKTSILLVLNERKVLGAITAADLLTQTIIDVTSKMKPSAEPLANSFNSNSTNQENLAEEFVAYVAHDIRNPLSLIVTVCDSGEFLVNSGEGQNLELNKMVRHAAAHALKISDSLLHLYKYKLQKWILPSKVSLSEFTKNLRAEVHEILNYRGFELEVEHCAEDDFEFDPTVISRACFNLIENACKHSKKGEKIFFRIDVVRPIMTNEAAETKTAQVIFSVRDEGMGIAQDKICDLAKPFKPIANKSKSQGYGLGLTIAKRFVELHGGQLRISTQEGRGSTFSLTIPAVSPNL